MINCRWVLRAGGEARFVEFPPPVFLFGYGKRTATVRLGFTSIFRCVLPLPSPWRAGRRKVCAVFLSASFAFRFGQK
jgi:hypothetical protein